MLVCERGACAGQLVCSVWTARPPAAPDREAHSTGEGVGHIRGCEGCAYCDALMNTLCQPTEVGTVPCTFTTATSLHVVTV